MKLFAATRPGAELAEIECDDPVPQGKEVLLKVRYSGVCHSDVHLREGAYGAGGPGEVSLVARGMSYPAVFGHETVGEVVALGPDVSDVRLGDLRLVFPWIGCDSCARCAAGRENDCRRPRSLGVFSRGGYASHILVPHERFLIDVEGLDPAWAATLSCSGVTSYSAVGHIPPLDSDEWVAVIGAGGVGLTAIALLRELSDANVVAVDVSAERLETARQMGAERVIEAAELADGTSIAELLGAPLAAVLDFVNTGTTFSQAFASVDKAGTIVSVGLFGGESKFSNAELTSRGIRIQGNNMGSLRQLRELVELAKRTNLPILPIINEGLSCENVEQGLQGLEAGKIVGRLVLSA